MAPGGNGHAQRVPAYCSCLSSGKSRRRFTNTEGLVTQWLRGLAGRSRYRSRPLLEW
jgi:hypothetical protein